MTLTQYRFDEQIAGLGDDQYRSLIAFAHLRAQRPYCMCVGGDIGIEVYVARRHEQFIVHRMPGTGAKHAPSCPHFEPADDLTGLGQLRGHAILHDNDSGEVSLKLGFPLSRAAARLAVAGSVEDKPTVKTDGMKMSLRGFLHYLWNEAQLTHWHPRMEGKRNWYVVRRALLGGAEAKQSKGQHLTSMVYVPENFSLEDKFEIGRRRVERTMRAHASSKQLMIIIAEVKNFEVSHYGEKIVCKHLPDWHLLMDDQLAKRMHKNFEREIQFMRAHQRDHLILCATFEIAKSELPHVREMTLMPVNENWVPYENLTDRQLVEQCTSQARHFIKGMRMNLAATRPIATVILTDTKPMATALYLRQDQVSDDYDAVMREHMTYAGVKHHIMRPGEALPLGSV